VALRRHNFASQRFELLSLSVFFVVARKLSQCRSRFPEWKCQLTSYGLIPVVTEFLEPPAELIDRHMLARSAEEPIPEGKNVAVVGIGVLLVVAVMNLVPGRKHKNRAQNPIRPAWKPHICVLNKQEWKYECIEDHEGRKIYTD
jgi:hypothetical protein